MEGLCLSLLPTFLYLPLSPFFVPTSLLLGHEGAGQSVLLLFSWPSERCSTHRSPSELGAGQLLACREKATPAEGLPGLGGGWTNPTTERPVSRLFRPLHQEPQC